MTEQTVPARQEQKKDVSTTREESQYLIPPVDIYETDEGLTVLADLPGVSKDTVEVKVEDNVLSISGKPVATDEQEWDYQEYSLLPFFRQFQLNEEVDQEKIQAELKNGVVRIHLPKAEKSKPRKIEIKAE